MGRIKMDFEERVVARAEELALEQTGQEFIQLPASERMRVWLAAERDINDNLADAADHYRDMVQGK